MATLIYVAVFAVLLVVIHVVSVRAGAGGRGGTPQGHLAKLVLLMNIPVFLGLFAWSYHQPLPASWVLARYLYASVVFNCFGYAYFHVFNMSETARRIRMLVLLKKNPALAESELLGDYRPADMVLVRIGRLEKMGHIVKQADGRYQLQKTFLLLVADVLSAFRRFVRPGTRVSL